MAVYSDDLVAIVKRDSFLTTAQGNFTDAQLLAIGDDFLSMSLIPLLLSEREGFFREYEDIPFVADQADYVLPTYAMYGKLESIQFLDNTERVLPYQLTRIEVENLGDVLPTVTTGTPRYFSVNSSAIRVYPTPDVGSALSPINYMRVYYDRRPGKLVLKSLAAQVLSVAPLTGVVTYTGAPPATFTSSSDQDFYNGQSPYQLKAQSTATAQSGSTQTFPVADVADLAAGDWVCPKDQTVFIPTPEELVPYLADMIILSLSRTQQDASLYQAQQAAVGVRAKATLSATGNRMPGNPKRIRLTNPLARNGSIPRYR